MNIPESIKSKRPTQFGAVEIRDICRHYYIYLASSRWDPVKGRPKIVTGKSIGKIAETDSFIPNANGPRLMKSCNSSHRISVKNCGSTSRTSSMRT